MVLSSPDIFEQLDSKTLKRLDLPKSAVSPSGLSEVLLMKVLTPVYLTNDSNSILHQTDIRAAAARTANGATFACPASSRRIVFSIRFNYTCTATVGTRTYVIDRRDKVPNVINRSVSQTLTASQTNNVEISSESASGGTDIHRQIAYPWILEAEWSITISDISNIDIADT